MRSLSGIEGLEQGHLPHTWQVSAAEGHLLESLPEAASKQLDTPIGKVCWL
jgi:hypothetical protein